MVENMLYTCHYSTPKWRWWRAVLTFQNNDPRCQTSKAACIAVQGLLVACPFHLLVPSAAIPAMYLGPHLPLFLRLLCLNLKSKGKKSFNCPGLNSVGLIFFFLFFYIGKSQIFLVPWELEKTRKYVWIVYLTVVIQLSLFLGFNFIHCTI